MSSQIVLIGKPTDTPPQNRDSIFVQVSLQRLTKATQAFIEVDYRRREVSNYKELLSTKDQIIADLSLANQINHVLNRENAVKIGALQAKANQYEDLYKDYKFELKKSKRQATLLKIGTPLITIGVGGLALLGGFYLGQALP